MEPSAKYEIFLKTITEAYERRNLDEIYSLWDKEQGGYLRELFFEDLHIIGGAISVLEKFSNLPLLLFRREHNNSQDVRNSDFFWIPYDGNFYSRNDATSIDKAFLLTRGSQKLDSNCPDFIKYLNLGEKYKYPFLVGKKSSERFKFPLQLFYCDKTEILIVLLCYLIILEKYQVKNPFTFPRDSLESLSFDSGTANEILSLITLSPSNPSPFDIYCDKIYLSRDDIKSIAERLGIDSPILPKDSLRIHLERLVSETFGITDCTKYSECLGILHTLSRFPIIPYLLIYHNWDRKRNGTECNAAHLVFPIWNSFVFRPKILLQGNTSPIEENKVIFALLTVNDHSYFCNSKESEERLELLSNIMQKLGDITADTIFYSKLVNGNKDREATKAAISQVMARNTSHNIGAHVMNKLIGDLGKLIVNNFKNYSSPIALYEGKTNNTEILLSQISIFNNYVKCRMDYLADISFGSPMMQTNKYVYEDLFKNLDEVRLLLEHISGLDNFVYQVEFKRNGLEFKESSESKGVDDLLVAMPNDILGAQALYNIIENIIRNTAKHSDKSTVNNGMVAFTVNFIDDIHESGNLNAYKEIEVKNILNEFIAVEIYDNIPVVGVGRDLTIEEKGEYYNKTKKNLEKFGSKIDELVFLQNKKLNEDILQDNKLRTYSLGLVEMDASAAYLRKRDISYINHSSYDIQYDDSWSRDSELNQGKQDARGTNCRHFLKAFKKTVVKPENDETESYLGYRFFLHRPAVVLLVTKILPKNQDELRKHGIWVTKPDEFQKELQEGKVYTHEFVVIDASIEFEIVNKNSLLEYYKTSLPVRILTEEINLSELIKNGAAEIEKRCWEKWETRKPEPLIRSSHATRSSASQAVFLDHLYSTDGSLKDRNEVQGAWEKNKGAMHLEALSSLAQSKMPQFQRITQNGQCKLEITTTEKFKCYISHVNEEDMIRRKIQEAILNKVIVVDERIQDVAENRDFMGISYKEIYAKMGVIVPDNSLNLSESSFENIGKRLEEFIDREIGTSDFILIHYSILERMYKDEELGSKLENWAERINVVITSGRGTPHNLPQSVRFINLSSVITSFVEVRSKYVINYLLNSSRKSNFI